MINIVLLSSDQFTVSVLLLYVNVIYACNQNFLFWF